MHDILEFIVFSLNMAEHIVLLLSVHSIRHTWYLKLIVLSLRTNDRVLFPIMMLYVILLIQGITIIHIGIQPIKDIDMPAHEHGGPRGIRDPDHAKQTDKFDLAKSISTMSITSSRLDSSNDGRLSTEKQTASLAYDVGTTNLASAKHGGSDDEIKTETSIISDDPNKNANIRPPTPTPTHTYTNLA